MHLAGTTVLLLLAASSIQSEEPLVTTTSGKVKGYTVSSPTGENLDIFLGIPYAEPPIGVRRFKHPEKVKPWSEIFEATSDPSTCYQKKIPFARILPEISIYVPFTKYSEDCLKLNIWVPHTTGNKLLPIMVWIYGGGYARGGISAHMFNATILSSVEKVIVIMMNYRVASLGFLYLDNPEIPGNAGLYDQLLALQWIKANANTFGGDPDSITLFGQSAGSSSVGQHLISPLSWGLFHRAIMSSGSPTSDYFFSDHDDAISKSMTVVDNLGCPRDNVTALIQCLQSAEPEDVIASEQHFGFDFVYIHFPVVDGKMVPDKPLKLLREGRFANVSLMIGSVKNEASIFLPLLFPHVYPLTSEFKSITARDGRNLMDFFKLDSVTQKIVEFLYVQQLNTPDDQKIPIEIVVNSASDFIFKCPLRDFELAYSRAGNRVFKYYFPYRSSNVKLPQWLGTFHTQEIPYIFG